MPRRVASCRAVSYHWFASCRVALRTNTPLRFARLTLTARALTPPGLYPRLTVELHMWDYPALLYIYKWGSGGRGRV